MRKRLRILVAVGAVMCVTPVATSPGQAQAINKTLIDTTSFSSTGGFQSSSDFFNNTGCSNGLGGSPQTMTISSNYDRKSDTRLSADCSIFKQTWNYAVMPGQIWHATAWMKISNVNNSARILDAITQDVAGSFRGRLKIHAYDDDDPLRECNQDITVATPDYVQIDNICVMPPDVSVVKVAVRARQHDIGIKTQGVTDPVALVRSRGTGTVSLQRLKVVLFSR